MAQVTVISGAERRRRWSDEQKRALVEAAFGPGAVCAEVAREADVSASQIYRWRRQFGIDVRERPGFAPVALTSECREASTHAVAAMMVEIGGAVVRIAADAPPGLVATVLRSLAR